MAVRNAVCHKSVFENLMFLVFYNKTIEQEGSLWNIKRNYQMGGPETSHSRGEGDQCLDNINFIRNEKYNFISCMCSLML